MVVEVCAVDFLAASVFLPPLLAPPSAPAGPDNNPRGARRSRYLQWDVVSPSEGACNIHFCLKFNEYQVLVAVDGVAAARECHKETFIIPSLDYL